MAINVTALNNYVEEKRLPLIAKSFLRGKTIDLIQIETGVLQDTALNLVSASVTFGMEHLVDGMPLKVLLFHRDF